MPRLVTVPLEVPETPLPRRVRELLDDADERIERFYQDRRNSPLPGFVPCDFVMAHHVIGLLVQQNLATGGRFCEWGSGAGVVTCLASLHGFDAIGIEIEEDLVELAEALAEDHGIEAEFIFGSFLPEDADDCLDEHAAELDREVTWLRTDGTNAYEQLGLDPDDLDVVFAYPWPGEEGVIFDLFAEFAAVGALLLTHHGEQGMKLQRKLR
ncbi:hypothetical protein [Botrimarina hoheduenensis]|uniref:Uncharacterized protein n=1 Tax=Botrimarina hoheduenensis TaxID=2528000 RepID=A0A5C5W810_9BACT|nr:hypothetical protein [Botrimarina hoheduenensis]TWT46724.1 hypothetical protein Pla111_18250 [Botrimarina hoheduenensis]